MDKVLPTLGFMTGLFLVCLVVLLTNAYALGFARSQQKHQTMRQLLDKTSRAQHHDIEKNGLTPLASVPSFIKGGS